MKEITVTLYEAEDGQRFFTEAQCNLHEKRRVLDIAIIEGHATHKVVPFMNNRSNEWYRPNDVAGKRALEAYIGAECADLRPNITTNSWYLFVLDESGELNAVYQLEDLRQLVGEYFSTVEEEK